ncbi:MAG: hypothetical protein HQK49_05010 [Oligoflexia bacterium]|nr:hypothetical protein [Oligoflexia bacterium]
MSYHQKFYQNYYKYFSGLLLAFFVAHSDLISQLAIWTIDSIFLIAKLFPNKIPSYVGNASFMALNYVGIISIPFLIKSMKKNFQDTIFSYYRKKKERQTLVAFASLLSGITTAVSIVDILAMSTAATIITFGNNQTKDIPTKMFSILIPIGSVMIATLIILEIYRILMNKHILKRMNQIFCNPNLDFNQLNQAANIIITTFAGREVKAEIYLIDLAIKIRTQMDVNTWRKCQQTIISLSLNNHQQLLDYINGPVKKDINICSADNYSNLILRAVGYFCMAIGRTHPNTLQQALAYWSMSTAYGIKNSLIKILQWLQRRNMQIISNNINSNINRNENAYV